MTADQHPGVLVDDGADVPVPRTGELWAVGALVLNQQGRAFAQKRGPHRRLFPDCWDIVGGHVEPGEGLIDALAREVEEETGRPLRRVRRLPATSTWTGDDGDGMRHEADYLVDVDGDLDRPALEWSKHTVYDWFGPEDLPRLEENRPGDDSFIHDLIAAALQEPPLRKPGPESGQ